eukprot:m.571265 g.571265  ORF g.571265 m.571265 type:complete len:413 (+) comp22266_c0_seq6:586-1824(+)
MAFLQSVTEAPESAMFKLTIDYDKDSFENKLDLGIGAYRDNDGNPYVLDVVKQASAMIQQKMESGDMNHEYLPIGGLPQFCKITAEFALGEDSPAVLENRAVAVQCLSGTGSLRTAGEFVAAFSPVKTILCSSPTWGNQAIFFSARGLDYQSYRYYKAETRALDLDGMLEDLKAAPQDACVVLHACAHNPTGVDPNEEQWQQIAEVCIAKNFFVIMDAAYLGFASGSPVKDSYAIRYFVSKNIPLVVCQSYSKIFGLYNERTGACLVVTPSEQTTKAVVSQMKVLVRRNWSNPPAHGARIVATVLSDAALKARWFEELKSMSGRIISMREKLYAALLAKKTPGTWNHIVDQIGMFTFTGLTEAHVAFLTEKYHIYMLKNGRINMAGLRDSTVEVLAGAIDDAVRNCSNVSKL